MTVKGTGFTKEWREQHGTVVIYIAATQDRPGNVEPSTSMLRFEEVRTSPSKMTAPLTLT